MLATPDGASGDHADWADAKLLAAASPTFPAIVAGTNGGSPPAVNVFDNDGNPRYALVPYDPALATAVRVAAGDVTGDGVADVITAPGSGAEPLVRVFDGYTGQPLGGTLGAFDAYAPAYTGGVYVAAGDVNGDGHADVITGTDSGAGPHVKVFSGADGSLL